MSGILCLKWNNHTNTFIQNLDVLRIKELYCDATITCYGKFYPVHRFVLTTCSEYFEEIFSRAQCKHPFIVLNEINQLTLEALLQYMYKGEVNVLQENLPGLIRAAEALKVKGLAVREGENEEKRTRNNSCSDSLLFEENDTIVPVDNIPVIEDSENAKETDIQDSLQKSSQSSSFENLNEDNLGKEETTKNSCEDSLEKDDSNSQPNMEENENIPSEETVEEKFKIPYVSVEADPPAFLSLLNSEKEGNEAGDSVSELVMPQCSSWTDALPDSDSVNKENLESSWLQSSVYDSFPLDPLHYLSCAGNSDSSSFSSFGLSESSSGLKEEKFSQGSSGSNSSNMNNKSHKYQCIECQFSTNDKAAFRLHTMRRHTGEKPFGCSVCSYRCTTRDMLKIHTRKHTGEKPFSCPYCNCRMTVKSSLKRHILLKHIQMKKSKSESSDGNISAGILKAYKCDFCSYESQMKSNLKLHCMRIHTGEKPIACTICSYRTTTKPQLEKHMRKHTGEKPFPCTFCPYRAAQKHTLLRHMALHTK